MHFVNMLIIWLENETKNVYKHFLSWMKQNVKYKITDFACSMVQNFQRSYISISAEIASTKQQQKLKTKQNKQTKHDKKWHKSMSMNNCSKCTIYLFIIATH